jgi:hypothetical protein
MAEILDETSTQTPPDVKSSGVWVNVSADSCEPACAHLPETGDDFTRVAAGELHGVFAEAAEAVGE